MARGLASFLLVLLVACGGDEGITVFVDLRTDLVAGEEFLAVRTEIGSASDERAALMGQSYLDGRRVADIGGLAPGPTTVRVVLLDGSGGLVAEQRIPLDLVADTGVTVVVTRDCLGVSCPGAGEPPDREVCLGGGCVTPECAGPLGEGCPPAECATDVDCAGPPCRVVRCAHGVCLTARDDSVCEPGAWCDPVLGCVTETPDGGTSRDGGVSGDGGMPATDGGPSPFDFFVASDRDTLAAGGTAELTLTTMGTSGLDLVVSFDVPAFTTRGVDDFTCARPPTTEDVDDDFERADATTLGVAPTGQSWSAIIGPSPGIDSGALAFLSTSYSVASIREPGRWEGRVAATLVRPADEEWLVAAIGPGMTYVRFGHCCGSTTYMMQNIVGGSVVPFASLEMRGPSPSLASGQRLELRVVGGAILALVNGALVYEVSDPAILGREPVGVAGLERGGMARFDDFVWGPEPALMHCTRSFSLVDETDTAVVRLTLAPAIPSTLTELNVTFTATAAGREISRVAMLSVTR